MEGNPPLPPEILGIVIEYLRDDVTALRSALLVNKTWAVEATRVLWENPPVTALAAIGEDRRQFYACHVRELSFSGDEEGAKHPTFRNLEFPQLNNITVGYFRPDNGEMLWLGQYIQSSMKNFSFYGTEPAEDILHLLETRCPLLRSIVIDFHFEGLTSDRLMKFFDNCNFLTSICLPSNVKYIIDSRLLAYLAHYDGLKDLELGKFLGYGMLDKILEGAERPFRNIRYIAIEIDSKTVPLLVAKVKSVLILILTLGGSRINPLPHVSSLVNLQELHIGYKWQVEWAGTDFLALGHLKNLRRLDVSSITSPTLTDTEFIPTFENMSQLEELVFQVQCVLSTAALTSLGEHCPRLITCDLLGSYDLCCWKSIKKPIFPQLLVLKLGTATYGEEKRL